LGLLGSVSIALPDLESIGPIPRFTAGRSLSGLSGLGGLSDSIALPDLTLSIGPMVRSSFGGLSGLGGLSGIVSLSFCATIIAPVMSLLSAKRGIAVSAPFDSAEAKLG
jgi:hypothetical protein